MDARQAKAAALMSARLTTSRKGHAYALDGERIPSVTTIIGNATNKRALIGWAARQAATWGATHADLLPAIGESDWIDQAARAHTRQSSTLAIRGTDAHKHARELVATGDATDVPESLLGLVEQAAAFLDAWGVVEIASERPCANTSWRYGGTFDLIAKLADDRTWLLDWKTGSGPWTEQALQLAAYAGCDIYIDEQGQEQEMPPVDRMGFVMLTPTSWDLVPVTATAAELHNYFTHMRHLNNFVEWTTPNSSGVARWQILGESLPAPLRVVS